MNASTAEFIVEDVEPSGEDSYHVIGRCCDMPIHVGDTFKKVTRYHDAAWPTGLAEKSTVDVEASISLRVEHIQVYEKCLSELGQGMTGKLVLTGDGIGLVQLGMVLGMRAL